MSGQYSWHKGFAIRVTTGPYTTTNRKRKRNVDSRGADVRCVELKASTLRYRVPAKTMRQWVYS